MKIFDIFIYLIYIFRLDLFVWLKLNLCISGERVIREIFVVFNRLKWVYFFFSEYLCKCYMGGVLCMKELVLVMSECGKNRYIKV